MSPVWIPYAARTADGLPDGDRQVHADIVAVADKEAMRPHGNLDQRVAGFAAP